MPLIAVVDASVLVSAFLFPDSVPGKILHLADQRAFTMDLSPILLEEVRRSLLNPRLRGAYGHDDAAVSARGVELRRIGILFDAPLPDIGTVCRDPDDDHVIAAAVAVAADAIVTGDKDLLALGQFHTIRILTSRAFLTELTA